MLKEFSPYLEYKDGILHFDGVNLLELVREFGTPLYVYSESHVRERAREYKKNFKDALLCFAVKSNYNLHLLRILGEEGFGADVVSGGELYLSLKAGIKGEKIVYAGVGKTEEEIKLAIEEGILMFNLESEEELYLLDELSKSLKKRSRVSIRVNPQIDPRTHPYIATGIRNSKFGIEYSRALEVYKKAKTLKNLEVVGIHCHIGSQILELSPFEEAFYKISKLCEELLNLGIELKYIDLGGGLGIKYRPEDKEISLEDYKRVVEKFFKGFPSRIVLEPGRSVVGNAGILITQVQFFKQKEGKNFLIVDAGMNDLLRPSLYSSYHHVVGLREGEEFVVGDLVGPICESGDFLAKGRKLPKVKRGDYLCILSAGAYGFSMSSNYNLRPRPAEVLLSKGNYKLIRRRETYQDFLKWF